MKRIAVSDIALTSSTLEKALSDVFGAHVLRKYHGPSLVAGEFDSHGKRTFSFEVGVNDVPGPLKFLFDGSRLRVTTEQTLETRYKSYVVKNRMRMHFLASELFDIRPTFRVRLRSDGRVVLSADVRHRASLVFPLDAMAETFMAEHSKNELERMAGVLLTEGVIPAIEAVRREFRPN